MTNTKWGTLNDSDILDLCSKGNLIDENFDEKRIKQACYELRCGNIYYDPSTPNERKTVNEGENILLKPKQTLIIITHESLRLPADILGRILTKGVLFSLGIVPMNTYADPGFSGKLGIVMSNISNNYIKLIPGSSIAKIEFSRLQAPVSRPYSGQHGYQTEIWPMKLDMIMKADEIKKDSRIKGVVEEVELSYGSDLAMIIKRVFVLERKLILSASLYFMAMIILIALIAESNWLSTTISVIIGVCSNIIFQLLFFASTRLERG